jgi:NADH dehydrogenase subunit H (EC 1.6.5.3)
MFLIFLASIIILLGVFTVAAFLVWAERKVAARIQDRLGPTRVGGRFGWLQSVADGIKILTKEDIIPRDADSALFRIAPYLALAVGFSWFVVLPFSEHLVVARVESAAVFLLALAGLEIYAVLLGGYASGSKWSLIGAMREAVQVVSYEVPLALCAVIPVLLSGSMDLVTIANAQSGGFWHWFVFNSPFAFLGFWVFMVCTTAGLNRAPFDLPEAESELVSGYMTEYSGFRWAVFMLTEYVIMFAVSALGAILFLGGWHGPLPITAWLGLDRLAYPWAFWIQNLAGIINLLVKAMLCTLGIIWARWTLPRLRIDQVMTMCLKYCLPLAIVAFFGSLLWKLGSM